MEVELILMIPKERYQKYIYTLVKTKKQANEQTNERAKQCSPSQYHFPFY